MPVVGPIKRNELIRNLKKLGFEGPLAGGNHQYMIRGDLKLHIPNPHSGDIGKGAFIQDFEAGGDREKRLGRALNSANLLS